MASKPLKQVEKILDEQKSAEQIIYPILVKVINEMENPKNSADNKYFNSKYAPLPDVLETVKPTLAKYGVTLLQVPVTSYEVLERKEVSKNGQVYTNYSEIAVIKLHTSILHESGAKLDFPPFILKAGGNTPQQVNSAITYARRYSALSILGIAGKEDDDDGNLASYGYNQSMQQQFVPQQQMAQQAPFQTQQQFNQPMQQQPQQNEQQLRKVWADSLTEVHNMLEIISSLTDTPMEILIGKLGKPLKSFTLNEVPELKARVEHWLKEAEKRAENQVEEFLEPPVETENIESIENVIEKTTTEEATNKTAENKLKEQLKAEIKEFIKGRNITLDKVLITLGVVDIENADEKTLKNAFNKLNDWRKKISTKEKPKAEKEATAKKAEKVEQTTFNNLALDGEKEVFSGVLLRKTDDTSVTGEARIKVEIEGHEACYANTSGTIKKLSHITEGNKVEATINRVNLIPYVADIRVVE